VDRGGGVNEGVLSETERRSLKILERTGHLIRMLEGLEEYIDEAYRSHFQYFVEEVRTTVRGVRRTLGFEDCHEEEEVKG